ncbi:hypothetical protein A5886_001896 [Enterococcus sp. 8G7_MSG3316]|uniref:ABC transporter domain-containing protein n=1 Tax=Candidatus Enterococcus testudinis TaxID=1834191 RepID=A0A242A6Z5_9ENTE|nr:ATP-binding cassette domain-containing protein [Enterococcus sp. 8G7_MSG3316]OTN76817.1 hypothetical protein A5886_001896 [Enterococcus sp. 8G7_MSG3316]
MSMHVDGCQFPCDQQTLTVSFTLQPGETIAIYGPSGSGKSTLFRILAGLSQEGFLSGTYTINGHTVDKLSISERASNISLLFQNPDTQFCMHTPREELLFCLENRAVSPEDMPQRVTEALSFCDIEALADQPLRTLSGGQKQLVALACCLVMDSSYLLLDEPFANLDEQTRIHLIQKLRLLQRTRNIGILLIDHQIAYVTEWVDRWLLIDQQFLSVDQGTILALEASIRQTLSIPEVPRPVQKKNLSDERLLIEHLRFPAGTHTISLPTYAFPAGGMIGIVGKSGIGKSTFLKVLLQEHPYEGTVSIDQKPVISTKQAFKQMSWIMQNPQDQFIAATVADELRAGQQEIPLDTQLAQLDLQGKSQTSPFLLSQGQQRRLAVASFLSRSVPVLLVDEPTYGQDIKQAWQIMQMLSEKANAGTLVLIVSHDTDLLQAFCSQIIDFNHYLLEEPYEKTQSNRQAIRDFSARIGHFFSNK